MLKPILQSIIRPLLKPNFLNSKICEALRFNGVNTYAVISRRSVDMDGNNVFEFYTGDNLNSSTIISQNVASNSSQREFEIFIQEISGVPTLRFIFGGITTEMLTPANGLLANTMYILELLGNQATVKLLLTGEILNTREFTRGEVRESLAETMIGARANGAVGTAASFFSGIVPWIRINQWYYTLEEVGQSIQLSKPSSLGPEVFNYTNYSVSGSVFKISNESFHYNVSVSEGALIRTSVGSLSPNTLYILEFEIFDYISGNLAWTAGSFTPLHSTNSNGFKRFLVSTNNDNRFQLGRNAPGTNLKIRNISFKSLGSSNPLTLFNVVPEQWQEIPCNLRP
ncbi:hypothetical protein ACO1PK_00700 [Alishewanella sp. d11]|uniref:hypothetical protein n=1 Tax=Alishewanella sp. d11 TaxID=3414030 RepID=UPI003BF926BF